MQIIIMVMFIIAWLANIKKAIDKNLFGKVIKPFYQMSCGLYQILKCFLEKSIYLKRLEERFKILYPNYKPSKTVKQFICYKLMYVLMFVFFGNLISFGLHYQEKEAEDIVDTVKRDSYWGDEREEELQVSIEGVLKDEPILFQVQEQQYSQEELKGVLVEEAKRLETLILKDNVSLEYVTSDLNLISKIPHTRIEVLWDIYPDEVIEYDGSLKKDSLSKEGSMVLLTATLTCEEESYIYSFYVNVFQAKLTKEQEYKKELLQDIETIEKNTGEKDSLELPKTVNGKQVHYSRENFKYEYIIILAVLVVACLVFFVQDEKLDQELAIRKKQLLLDYPEIVSKLTLLLGAGMTIRGALDKIALDYAGKKRDTKRGSRYAYDELLLTCREMQGGLSERQGIDKFGKRCQIPCYMKFSSLLLQNLKKGSRGMAEVLDYEVSEAFENRKNLARRAGEEAGTKLLISMMLMLLVVLVILIVPACLAF